MRPRRSAVSKRLSTRRPEHGHCERRISVCTGGYFPPGTLEHPAPRIVGFHGGQIQSACRRSTGASSPHQRARHAEIRATFRESALSRDRAEAIRMGIPTGTPPSEIRAPGLSESMPAPPEISFL